MRKVKSILYFSLFGFIISFIFGLFSHSSFFSIFAKALLFFVIFAVLGFLASFLFSKFLDDDTIDVSTEERPVVNNENKLKGAVVDLVIREEELEPKQSDNSFFVGSNRQMLNSSDVSEKKAPSSNVEKNEGFVPLRNFETSTNLSGTESVSYKDAEAVKSRESDSSRDEQNSQSSGLSDELDVLPDMAQFAVSSENHNENNEDGFAPSYSGSKSNKADSFVGDMPDTGLIAKAISSVLSEESS